MSPTLVDFLFEAVNFLILAAVLGRVLFKPVRGAIEDERERRAAQEKEGERLEKESEAVRQKSLVVREKVEQEAEETRKQIIADARRQAAELLEKARKTQREERQALDDELAAKRDAQTAAVADTVGRLAANAVRELMLALSGPSLDTALVKAGCAQLDNLPKEARASAVVESAQALDDAQRKILQETLGEGFEERVVPELGAGVRVTTAAGQVDATAVSIARTAGGSIRDSAARDMDPAEEEEVAGA